MSDTAHLCTKPALSPGTYVQLWKCPECGEKWEYRSETRRTVRLVVSAVLGLSIGVLLGYFVIIPLVRGML